MQCRNRAVGAMVLAAGLGTLGSATVDGQAGGPAQPDVVYYNGKIATVNATFEMVQAVAVRQGRIVAVGSNESVRALAAQDTRQVDLQGKTVLPGFYDNHVHLGMGGSAPDPNLVDPWAAKSLDEVLEAIRQKAAKLPKGEWIRVNLPYLPAPPLPFPQDKAPTRWDLDKAAPDHPVYVSRGHLAVVNTLGLQRAGITKSTSVPGGMIVRDAKGELTGQLRETPARKLVERVMPPRPVSVDPETRRADFLRFAEGLLALGITRANVIGPELTALAAPSMRWLQDVYAVEGTKLPRLTVQRRLSPGYDRFDDLKTAVVTTIRELEAMPFHTGFGDERLKIGAIKMSIDGAFSGPSAWLLEEYPNWPGYSGAVRIPEDGLYAVAKRAHELGWQLGIHAIGDAAVQMTVNVLERIMKESPRPDPRHYIHHFTVKPPEATLKKVAALGIIVASQPNWTYSKIQFTAAGVRGERLETSEPQQSLLDHGIRVSYGSDGLPFGPILGIFAAVTRMGGDGKVYGPAERVSLQQAIRNYTFETAYMNFEEQDQGSLEVGKLADMIVLAEDIFTVAPERIKDVGVEKTIIGGEVVYSTTKPMKPWRELDHPWWTEPTVTSTRQP